MGFWMDCDLLVGGDPASLNRFELGEAEKIATRARRQASLAGRESPSTTFEPRKAEADLALRDDWSPFWNEEDMSGQKTPRENVRRYWFVLKSSPQPTRWLADVGRQHPSLRFVLLWADDWTMGQDRWRADAYVMAIELSIEEEVPLVFDEIGGRTAWLSEALNWAAGRAPDDLRTSPLVVACQRLFAGRPRVVLNVGASPDEAQ
jgi:hypothetical protein